MEKSSKKKVRSSRTKSRLNSQAVISPTTTERHKTSSGNKLKSSIYGSKNVSKSIIEKLGRVTTNGTPTSGNANSVISTSTGVVRWFEYVSDVENNDTSSGVTRDVASPLEASSRSGEVQNVEQHVEDDDVDEAKNVLLNSPQGLDLDIDLDLGSKANLQLLSPLDEAEILGVTLEMQSSKSTTSTELIGEENHSDSTVSSHSDIEMVSIVSKMCTKNLLVQNDMPSNNSSKRQKKKAQLIEKKLRRPGRHKVKVLENPSTSQKSHSVPEQKSPYRSEDFIDVDGKVKINGKAFDTYITHEEYLLLKEFYIPGLIASASRSPSRKSKVRRFHSFVEMMNLSPIPRASRSSSQMSKTSPFQKNSDKLDYLNTINQRSSNQSVHVNAAVSVTDVAQQTLLPDSAHTETQTHERGPRRTVEFDLARNSVRSFEPDSVSNVNLSQITWSDTTISITSSDLDLLPPRSSETVSDLNVLTHGFFNDAKEEEILWSQKTMTALRMTAAILTAQEATTETVNSPLIQNVLCSMSFEDRQELLDFVSNERKADTAGIEESNLDIESPVELLLRLVDVFGCAYTHILRYIEATNLYEYKFPNGAGRYSNRESQIEISKQQRSLQFEEIEGTSLVEASVEDTQEINEVDCPEHEVEVVKPIDMTHQSGYHLSHVFY